MFGLTRGEIILVVIVFALVYGAGLLPKLTRRLSAGARGVRTGDKPDGSTDE